MIYDFDLWCVLTRYCFRRQTGAFRSKDNSKATQSTSRAFSDKYQLRETDKRLHRLKRKKAVARQKKVFTPLVNHIQLFGALVSSNKAK